LEFLGNNSINSVRLPLSAQYLIQNPMPQLAYINGWENKELTTWTNPNAVTYFDLVGRVVQTLQNQRVSVLLDIHLLDKYLQDAFWYTAPYVEITKSPTYQAAEYLAKAFCNATYWNILGIDLKDEMSDVQWSASAADANPKNDWASAATTIANRVLELCPSWLVFVGGASSPTTAQGFTLPDYKTPSRHWDGGNLHNATKRPLNVTLANKIVFAPHAHAHGKLPQNYFYGTDVNCTKDSPTDYFGFEDDQLNMECVDFVNGAKVKSKMQCSTTEYGCSTYKHITGAQIATNYKKVMDEAMGDVLKEAKTPVIFGSFSGVYGAAVQPHQTAALDFLIDYAATTLRGGYFYALNPDTEYYLEDSTNNGSGLFGKTHYGLFKTTSWQEPNTDLLEALKKLPASAIPCYGGKNTGKGGMQSAAPATRTNLLGAIGAFVAAAMVYAM
jgi:aryl-phospho-beta-D-glucosidase BglC (GH1 family)